MCSRNIIDIKSVKEDQLDIAGGKGVNLGIMLSNDIPVPGGFIITSHAYKYYLNYNGISKLIEKKINNINEDNMNLELTEIRENILNSEYPKDLKDEILDMYNAFPKPVHVAVRSSATAEDLPEASFAGQQETYLNVIDSKDLLLAIKKCYASLWSPRSFTYRSNNKFDHLEVSIAIVVQEMINSEISGVLFTANPNNGEKEVLIDASYGLGEAIVSGRVTPDNYILDKDGKEVRYIAGSKEISIIYSGKGTKEVINSEEMRKKRCLNKDNLYELFNMAKNVENLYKKPMDIEWAIKSNKVYILQARPITTIKNINKVQKKYSEKEKKYLNNMVEHFPIPFYPVDYKVGIILQDMKFDLFKEVGLNIESPINMDSSGKVHMSKIKWKITPKVFKFPKVYADYKNNSKNIKEGEEILNSCISELNKIEMYFEKNVLSLFEVSKYMDCIIKIHKKISYARFRYFVFPAVIIGERLDKEIKRVNKQYTQYDLLANLRYVTVNINEDIDSIGKEIVKNKALLKDMEKGIRYEDIKNNYAKEFDLINGFLKKYGWKSNYCCIPFSSISWNEDPNRFLKILEISILSKKENREVSAKKYEEIIGNLKAITGPRKINKLLDDISYYRLAHIKREESQYFWEKGFGLLRYLLNEVSKRVNMEYTDLLYLTIDELKDMLGSGRMDREYKEIISNRKASRGEAEAMWEQMTIDAFSDNEKNLFKGISGSLGVARGNVCIVKNHNDFGKLQKGDILVCPYTDPEWTPLFKVAKAVVSDTGGALSHAAIVAREYGIPAVLGVGNATSNLSDGEEVIVDGNNGSVKKILL